MLVDVVLSRFKKLSTEQRKFFIETMAANFKVKPEELMHSSNKSLVQISDEIDKKNAEPKKTGSSVAIPGTSLTRGLFK